MLPLSRGYPSGGRYEWVTVRGGTRAGPGKIRSRLRVQGLYVGGAVECRGIVMAARCLVDRAVSYNVKGCRSFLGIEFSYLYTGAGRGGGRSGRSKEG